MRRIGLFALMILLGMPAYAEEETRYVSDELRVALRGGPTMQHRILAFLVSGTPLEVMETEDEWTRVQDPEGREGWVQTDQLMSQPHARQRLAETETSLEEARAARAELEQSLEERAERIEELEELVDSAEAEIETLEEKLERSDRGLALADENERLEEVVVELRERVGRLEGERDVLRQRDRRDLILAGAGILVGGVLVGLILPRIRWRRRNRWDDPF